MIRSIAIVIGFLLWTNAKTLAQVVGMEVGAQAGVAHYFGDLNNDYSINKPGFTGGLLARYSFNRRIALKASFNYASVAGDDALSDNEFQLRRNLSFASDVINGGLQLEFNFLPFVHGDKDLFFTPYLFGGLAMTYYNPKAELNGEKYVLRDLGTEGQPVGDEYSLTSGGWLYGGGVKFSLNYHWSINVELGIHQLFTDYLDDVSTIYPETFDLRLDRGDIAVLLSDRSIPTETQPQIGQPGRQRGNSAVNDTYAVFTVGVTYFLGDLNCPPISRQY